MSNKTLPKIGLGTYSDSNRSQWTEVVSKALELGYRHIDTARDYKNQRYVGNGIANADVPREDVFLSTKVVHIDTPGKSYDEVVAAAEECLDRLGTNYVDLLYIHWPIGVYDAESTLRAFEDLYDEGKVMNIGLSNFTIELLEEARGILSVPILAHQFELHPLLYQEQLLDHAHRHDYHVVAYSPLGQGSVFDIPELSSIAVKHGVSEAQVSLAWLLNKENVHVIPKTVSKERLQQNLEAVNLELDREDIEKIDNIDKRERIIDFENAPWN